jgi:transposase
MSAPSVIERVKTTLVALKMPRALEVLDVTLRGIERGEIGAVEAIDALLTEELTTRENRRVRMAVQMARLSAIKTLAGFDFAFQPSLDRNRILALAGLQFVDRAEALHLIGPPGTGKTHLSLALGVEAVKAGRSVYFSSLADIVATLAKAERDGALRDRIRYYCRFALLIVDEIGYLPVTPGGGNLFFQLVNARYEKGAMILTSNRGFAEWGDIFGDSVVATALLDRSHGEVDSDQRSGRVRLRTLTLETTMPAVADRHDAPTAIQSNLAAIFISLELSRSIWLVTSLSPGSAEKMSKHSVRAGDVAALLARFSELKRKASERTGKSFPIVVIHEAGLDGFWLHRVLQSEGIESHVVDPASIATSRRRRRAKTDRIDGEALLRALLAFKRGEPRVCAMVKAPTPEEEDRRRLGRERKVLIAERVKHVNRVKGLLFSQGVSGYEPLRRDRRQRLDELTTGDGRSLPMHLKTQISRELDRLELLLDQIKRAEAERDALLAAQQAATPASPGKMLLEFRGIGAEFAASLWLEALFRQFGNRRQLASYAGLAPTPWQSGSVDHEQGVSKAGNPRLRTTLVQLAWLWLRHQPQSALALWFKERVNRNGGRLKKTTIVALARKLLVALWKYVTAGVVIEGAVMKDA